MLHNSQLRYAIIYVLITMIALFFLNILAANQSRSAILSANQDAEIQRACRVSPFFVDVDASAMPTQQTVELLEAEKISRVAVLSSEGEIRYDSLEAATPEDLRVLSEQTALALSGEDVFDSRFLGEDVLCCTMVPMMNGETVIGAVYVETLIADLGRVVHRLDRDILWTSVAMALGIIAFSAVFSVIYAKRMRRIMDSIRIVREGDYSHKLAMDTHDEMEQLSKEFNSLTDRLQTSEQRRRQFVSDASHELKTPLASIKLLSDSILQNDMDAETTKEFVGDIGDEADRLTRMSHKLLELARLDAMPQERRELVDMQAVARRVFRMLKPQMNARSIHLEDATVAGCIVRMQADDLYQIIFNLVENGIKYNVEGGLLRLSLEMDEHHVTMRVEDSGVGIPPDAIGHIFERFYRVDKARSRQAGGSGLGLSIANDMVKRNYGSIRAENRPEGGTCFTVVFPSCAAQDAASGDAE